MMKKILSLCLGAALLLALLAGCGAAADPKTPEPLPSAEASAEPTAEATAEATVEPTEPPFDPSVPLAEKFAAYPAETVVMSVDGREITWDLYYYWLGYFLSSYASQRGALPTAEEYAAPLSDGLSLDETLRAAATSYITYYACLLNHADAEKVALDAETEAELEASWQAVCEQNGGEEAMRALLAQNCMTENSFRFYALRFDPLYDLLTEKLHTDALTPEDAAAWATDNATVRVKHILRLTTDESGAALDETAKAAVLADMESVRAELAALADDRDALLARFDELIGEKSEDPGLASYPDGYVFTTGEMVTEFEDAAFALEDYALSELVETSYGYHLLLRLPMELDITVEYDKQTYAPVTLREKLALLRMSEDISAWSDAAEVVPAPAFESFTVAGLFAE